MLLLIILFSYIPFYLDILWIGAPWHAGRDKLLAMPKDSDEETEHPWTPIRLSEQIIPQFFRYH